MSGSLCDFCLQHVEKPVNIVFDKPCSIHPNCKTSHTHFFCSTCEFNQFDIDGCFHCQVKSSYFFQVATSGKVNILELNNKNIYSTELKDLSLPQLTSLITIGNGASLVSGGLETVDNNFKSSNAFLFLKLDQEKKAILKKSGTSLLVPRHAHFSICDPKNNTVFLLGGLKLIDKKREALRDVEIFSLDNEKTCSGPSLNNPRFYASGILLKRTLYIFGGFSLNEALNPVPFNEFEMLDLESIDKGWGKLELKTNISKHIFAGSACVSRKDEESFFILGGSNGTKSLAKDIYEFKNNEVTKLDNCLKEGRVNALVHRHESGLVFILGGDINNKNSLDIFNREAKKIL